MHRGQDCLQFITLQAYYGLLTGQLKQARAHFEPQMGTCSKDQQVESAYTTLCIPNPSAHNTTAVHPRVTLQHIYSVANHQSLPRNQWHNAKLHMLTELQKLKITPHQTRLHMEQNVDVRLIPILHAMITNHCIWQFMDIAVHASST